MLAANAHSHAERPRPACAGTHGLTVLRRHFVSFAAGLIMVGAAVVFLAAASTVNPHPLGAVDVAIGVIVCGVCSLVAPRLIEKPLDCSEDRLLAGSYRTRFFLRLAFADTAAVVGLVGFIESNNGWMYAIGAVFAAAGFFRLAPSASNLAKDQQALSDTSCQRSLIAALATQLPPPTRSRRRR